jgi:hypothetical protein
MIICLLILAAPLPFPKTFKPGVYNVIEYVKSEDEIKKVRSTILLRSDGSFYWTTENLILSGSWEFKENRIILRDPASLVAHKPIIFLSIEGNLMRFVKIDPRTYIR